MPDGTAVFAADAAYRAILHVEKNEKYHEEVPADPEPPRKGIGHRIENFIDKRIEKHEQRKARRQAV